MEMRITGCIIINEPVPGYFLLSVVHKFVMHIPKNFMSNRLSMAGVAAHFYRCIFEFPLISVAGNTTVYLAVAVPVCNVGTG